MPSPGHQKNNSTTANSNSASTTSGNSIGGTSASSKECVIDMNHLKKPVSSSVEAQQALYAAAAANFGANPFSTAASSNTPIFPPLIDMSSTQALLSMVRTASAHNASQLENYLKGANKRPSPSESSPLDLSSGSIPTYKRSRTNKGAGGASETIFLNSDSLLHVPMVDALRTTKERLGKRTGSVSPKPPVRNNGGSSAGSSPRLLPSSTVTSASATASQQHVLGRNLPCLSMCSADRACSSGGDPQAMAQWSVEDVCSFVASIDICAEYAPVSVDVPSFQFEIILFAASFYTAVVSDVYFANDDRNSSKFGLNTLIYQANIINSGNSEFHERFLNCTTYLLRCIIY